MTLNTLAWKSCITILQAISIGSTIIRLGHRWCTKRMWWDDWIAIIPLLGNCLYVVIMWLDLGGGVDSGSFSLLFSPWFGTFMFYTIVWVSRVSLALSIARIFPSRHNCRRFALGLTAFFLMIYIANILMSTFDCYKLSSSWYNMPFQDCIQNRKGALVGVYATVVLDLLADLLLVISPLTMLWKVKLPKQQRRLILVLFSSSMIPLLASVAYCIIWGLSAKIGPDSFLISRILSQLQAGISLLVCNLLVVTMLFYRIVRRENVLDPSPDNDSTPPPRQQESLSEKRTSETRDASSPRTQYENSNLMYPSEPQSLSPPISLVLTSIYDDSIQFSSIRHSSTHRSSILCSDEESSNGISLPPWSFPESSSREGYFSNMPVKTDSG